MPFNLSFQNENPQLQGMQLQPGTVVFILGANGTGKSSLMQRFSNQNRAISRKISAHRQTWMSSDTPEMTAKTKTQAEQNIRNEESNISSRFRDVYAAQRASMTLYDLVNAENVRARKIAAALKEGDLDKAHELNEEEAPIATINELLRLSNIAVEVNIEDNDRIVASKDGGPAYGIDQLSDGERNALLVAGDVLTAPTGSLLLIDEPEPHLHRAIISPLLTQLFSRRDDCAYVVSTHDLDLPLDNPEARILLLRGCTYLGQNPQSWVADEVSPEVGLDDILKRDVLGSRRKVLFVEGTESSLDKPLYSLIFPMISVVPKGSCREVEMAVRGVNAGGEFHWLQAYGIGDGDGFDADTIAAKREIGVVALPYYSVEAIYFHTGVINLIAAKQAVVMGGDPAASAAAAIDAGIAAVATDLKRLCQKAVKKSIRKNLYEQIPNDDELIGLNELEITVAGPATLEERLAEAQVAIQDKDWEALLAFCPIRECAAQSSISTALGFRKLGDYRNAVRHLLATDTDALAEVRTLFGNLHDQITDRR